MSADTRFDLLRFPNSLNDFEKAFFQRSTQSAAVQVLNTPDRYPLLEIIFVIFFKEKFKRAREPSEHPPVRGKNVKTFR